MWRQWPAWSLMKLFRLHKRNQLIWSQSLSLCINGTWWMTLSQQLKRQRSLKVILLGSSLENWKVWTDVENSSSSYLSISVRFWECMLSSVRRSVVSFCCELLLLLMLLLLLWLFKSSVFTSCHTLIRVQVDCPFDQLIDWLLGCYVVDKIVEFVDDVMQPESDSWSSETRRAQPKHSKPARSFKPAKKLKLVLQVYGLTTASIDSAIREIENLCKDAKKERLLSSPQVQHFVSKMTQDQVATYWQYFVKCVGLQITLYLMLYVNFCWSVLFFSIFFVSMDSF